MAAVIPPGNKIPSGAEDTDFGGMIIMENLQINVPHCPELAIFPVPVTGAEPSTQFPHKTHFFTSTSSPSHTDGFSIQNLPLPAHCFHRYCSIFPLLAFPGRELQTLWNVLSCRVNTKTSQVVLKYPFSKSLFKQKL